MFFSNTLIFPLWKSGIFKVHRHEWGYMSSTCSQYFGAGIYNFNSISPSANIRQLHIKSVDHMNTTQQIRASEECILPSPHTNYNPQRPSS